MRTAFVRPLRTMDLRLASSRLLPVDFQRDRMSVLMSPELSLRKPWLGTDDATHAEAQVDDAFIQRHYGDVYRVAWLMLGDVADAEDIAQQTFVVAMERAGDFRGDASPRGWLQGILVRLVMRRRRWYARFKRRLANYAQRQPEPSSGHCRHHQRWQASVWASVARLTPHHAAVVQLRYGSQMKVDDIAVALDIPVGTVKSRLHHALRQLRDDDALRRVHETLTDQEPTLMETLDDLR